MEVCGVAEKRVRVCSVGEHHGIKSYSMLSSPSNCMEKRTTLLDLGEDLLAEILRYLPLKSFTQCLCVCKKWRSLITCNPLLRRNHLLLTIVPRNSISNARCRTDPRILGRDNYRYRSLEKHERNDRILGLEFSFAFLGEEPKDLFSLCASCNGLHLISRFRGPPVRCFIRWYIFNPWTREYADIGVPRLGFLPIYCGLAFDSEHWQASSNNNSSEASYKVVVLKKEEAELIANIYSSETRSWQLLRMTMPWRSQHIGLGNAVYCNRILHWVCGVTCALLFNVEKETFDLLDLPSISSSKRRNVRVPANLCHSWFEENCPTGRLIECRGQLHYLLIGFNLQLHIWKMSTTSNGCYDGWVMLHTVDLKLPVNTDFHFFPPVEEMEDFPYFEAIDMGCVGDDKVLLSLRRTKTVWYDLKTGSIQPFREKVCDIDRDYFRYNPTTKRLGNGLRRLPDPKRILKIQRPIKYMTFS